MLLPAAVSYTHLDVYKRQSLQGVRDYLGHVYEEMTRQYIDYMPRKLANANEEYFSKHNSLAASLKKGKE